MNANAWFVVFLGALLAVGGASVATGSSAPPLVDDVETADRFDGECHLNTVINTDRLDADERLVVERGYGENDSRADVLRSGQGVKYYGGMVATGGTVTIYRVGVEGPGSVDVVEHGLVTYDCRLVDEVGS